MMKTSKAFSIVELIVVIAIIGIVAALSVFGYGTWRDSTDRSTIKSDLSGVVGAMENARNFDNQYPTTVPTSFNASNGVTINGGSFASGSKFCVTATKGDRVYFISPAKVALPGTCPTAYYDTGESASYPGAGRSIKDLSGTNTYNLTIRDGLNETSGGPTFVPSELSGALLYDGVNDNAYSNTQFDFGPNMTWAMCSKMVANVNPHNMMMGRTLPYFGIYNGDTIHFSNYIGGVQRSLTSAVGIITTNRWNCYTFTTAFDGTNTVMSIYLNGTFMVSGTYTGQQTNISTYRLTIGDGRHDQAAGFWYPFNGYVSDIAIYPRTLSAVEINANFKELRAKYGI